MRVIVGVLGAVVLVALVAGAAKRRVAPAGEPPSRADGVETAQTTSTVPASTPAEAAVSDPPPTVPEVGLDDIERMLGDIDGMLDRLGTAIQRGEE
jgi:hypothetical protein